MPSTFLNLLRYARSTEIEATENFTTEALAACIRSDPAPVLFLLERLSVIGSADEVAEVVALTQVTEVGAGIIDLVLQLRLPDRLAEVWVEIKVAAGESGNQIDNYRRFSVGKAFYQPRPFFASDDVLVLVPKTPLTPAAAHFLCALIRAERFRFSYGRKWNMERMKQSVMRLPITSGGEPDWTLMERFIEALPYSSSIGVVS